MMRLREAARAQLIFSFRKILKPMIRILLRAGIPYLEFREVLKGAYVEAAVRDGIKGQVGPLTRSMLSDHTGVPLADINRFIDDARLLAPPESTTEAIITEVLHVWCTDPFYIGPYGLPLELDLEETPGRNLTTLIYSADPMASPRAVLNDMIEYGMVRQVGTRHYRALSRSNLFSDIMSPQALEYFGRTITDLANTVEFNIAAPTSARRLQRSVVADGGIPEHALPEFESLLKDKVQKLLLDVDDWLSTNKPLWADEGPFVQTGLTTFHYITEPYDHTPLASIQPLDERDQPLPPWSEPAIPYAAELKKLHRQ
jgi:Family of unknown function (DUF6502)